MNKLLNFEIYVVYAKKLNKFVHQKKNKKW